MNPEWEQKPIQSFTRQDVKEFLLEKQVAGLVINNIRICISAVFAEAVEREIVQINPAHNLGRVFKKGNPKKQTRFLSKEQVAKLLDAAKEQMPVL